MIILINVNTQLNNYFKSFILVARGARRIKVTKGTGRAKGSLRRSNRILGRSKKELEEVEKNEEDEEEEEEEVLISSTQQSTQ